MAARVSHAYKQETAECSIICTPLMSNNFGPDAKINVVMGGTVFGAVTRFVGYVQGVKASLWTGQCEVISKGALIKAKNTHPKTQGGIYLGGQADEDIITQILTESGLTSGEIAISGNGKILGSTVVSPASDARFLWPERRNGLWVIHDYDLVSAGWRVVDTPFGTVIRQYVDNTPKNSAVAEFNEGVDFFTANSAVTVKKPKNKITSLGWNGAIYSVQESNPQIPASQEFLVGEIYSPLIESSLDADLVGQSAQSVATYTHRQLKRYKLEVSFTTPRDDLLAPGQTVKINGTVGSTPRIRLTNQNMFIQSIQTEITEMGVFTQTLTVVSELPEGVYPPGSPATAPPPPLTPLTPVVEVVTSNFAIVAIDKESVLVAGVPTDLYTVFCEDGSTSDTGTIASVAWSTAGIPASGTGKFFKTTFLTTLVGATITLTATSSTAVVGDPITKAVNVEQVGVKLSKLTLAFGDEFHIFDGTTWRVDTPSSGIVIVAGNGPVAGTGTPFTVPTCAGGGGLAAGLFGGRGTGELFVGSDGITWTRENDVLGDEDYPCGMAASTNSLWAAMFIAGTLKHSEDSGVTWADFTLPGGFSFCAGIKSSVTGILVACFTNDYSSFTFQSSTDEGATWLTIGTLSGVSPWYFGMVNCIIETADPTKPRAIWAGASSDLNLYSNLTDNSDPQTISNAAGGGTSSRLVPSCEIGSTTAMVVAYNTQKVYKILDDLTIADISPASWTNRAVIWATCFDTINLMSGQQFAGGDQDDWRGEIWRSTGISILTSDQTDVRLFLGGFGSDVSVGFARRASDGLWIGAGNESVESATYFNGVEGAFMWYSTDDGVTWTQDSLGGDLDFHSGKPEIWFVGAF